MRACGFEKMLEKRKESDLARMCWEELRMREEEGRIRKRWEKERKGHFEERGIEIGEIEIRRKKGDF